MRSVVWELLHQEVLGIKFGKLAAMLLILLKSLLSLVFSVAVLDAGYQFEFQVVRLSSLAIRNTHSRHRSMAMISYFLPRRICAKDQITFTLCTGQLPRAPASRLQQEARSA